MSVFGFFTIWFLLSIILAPIIGTVIKNNSTTLDEEKINN
jgi:hypothetical protein